MNFRVIDTVADAIKTSPASNGDWAIKRSATYLAQSDHLFETLTEAQAFVEHLYRLPVGAIAIDTEYRYRTPGVPLKGGGTWYDPKTLEPLILSGTAWVPAECQAIRFMFDLRMPGIATVFDHLLRMRAVFVAHNFKAEYHTLWAMGLNPVLTQTYDTYVAARALMLGRGHRSITLRQEAQGAEDWDGLAKADAQIASLLSLVGQCEAYGITHPFAGSKSLLQDSFLDHPTESAFDRPQVDYAMTDAEVTLRLYLAQQPDIIAAGLNAHLYSVEFPYVEANARMEFDGVPVAKEKIVVLSKGLRIAVDREAQLLKEQGLKNPGSPAQVIDFLCRRGWRDKVSVKGKLTSNNEVLERIKELDSAIPHIQAFRSYRTLLGGQFVSGELIGSDNRLHPNHRQLGAETGRNTCSAPNVVGLSRQFRPVITAPTGRAIIEADYAQIEVGIAAAEAGDLDLIQAFNSGDVYASVARTFFWSDLTEEEKQMDLATFKIERSELRDRIKVFVLATIYNMQDQSVAEQFAIPLAEAKRQRAAFLDQFPGIGSMMLRAEQDGRLRGFAPIIGGLRRHIPSNRGSANQHINTPIQAGAGVVFRKAVVDLYRHFRKTSTQIIFPVHDAVVVECDEDTIATVSDDLARIMSAAAQAYYPELDARVDVNTKDVSCWNKDGKSDSIERFLDRSNKPDTAV